MLKINVSIIGRVAVGIFIVLGGVIIGSSIFVTRENAEIISSWEKFKDSRSVRTQVVTALRSEMGYGGMIHQFKNLVLRRQLSLVPSVQDRLDGAGGALAQLTALGATVAEDEAVKNIQVVLDRYKQALIRAEQLIKQGKTVKEIDQGVKVDDSLALAALNTLDMAAGHSWEEKNGHHNKFEALSVIRGALGYGGMIHHFKNFVLRQNTRSVTEINFFLDIIWSALAEYEALGLKISEKQSLASIRQVVGDYEKALQTAQDLIAQGYSAEEIDHAVKLDDGPVLRGLLRLSQESIIQTELHAKKIEDSLDLFSFLANLATWVTMVLTITMIAAAIWLTRILQKSLVSRNKLTLEVSDRKRAEIALGQAKREAEAANIAKSEFLANMSHELRTPLNAVIGFSEVLNTGIYGPVNDRQSERLGDIHAAGSHLLNVIDDILDLSKVEAHKIELAPEILNVRNIIDSVVLYISEHTKKADISLVTDVPENTPDLYADQRLLKQMLINLLSNAVKFTPANGQINISVFFLEAGGIGVEVRDNGVGIAREDIPKVMESFKQVGNAMTKKHKGSGLGLPLVKSFIELHGGELDLKSELEIGTTACLNFPAIRVR